MRLATWNVNNVRKRLPQLLEWLARTQPDVVALQELKTETGAFPKAELEAAGQVRALGQARAKRWLAPAMTGIATILLLPALPPAG